MQYVKIFDTNKPNRPEIYCALKVKPWEYEGHEGLYITLADAEKTVISKDIRKGRSIYVENMNGKTINKYEYIDNKFKNCNLGTREYLNTETTPGVPIWPDTRVGNFPSQPLVIGGASVINTNEAQTYAGNFVEGKSLVSDEWLATAQGATIAVNSMSLSADGDIEIEGNSKSIPLSGKVEIIDMEALEAAGIASNREINGKPVAKTTLAKDDPRVTKALRKLGLTQEQVDKISAD